MHAPRPSRRDAARGLQASASVGRASGQTLQPFGQTPTGVRLRYAFGMRSNAAWSHRRRLAFVVLALAAACSSEGEPPDAGTMVRDAAPVDAGPPDAGLPDTGPPPDAGPLDTGVPPDAGPPPPTPCTCLHGAHLECGPGQVCLGGYEGDEQTACIRREPRGGAMAGACTDNRVPWSTEAPCSATCVPAEEVRVCAGRTASLGQHFDRWVRAMQRAITRQVDPIRHCNTTETVCGFDPIDVPPLRNVQGLSPECIRATAATAVQLAAVCGGDHLLVDADARSPFDMQFNVSDACTAVSIGHCFAALSFAVDEPGPTPISAAILRDGIAESCPSGPPPGPCANTSSTAHAECLADAVRRIERALER